LGLFNESLDLATFLGNDHTITTWFFNFSHNDSAFFAMAFVELNQLVKGIIANDVRVKHEEELVRVLAVS
jgi:hypothetical protein